MTMAATVYQLALSINSSYGEHIFPTQLNLIGSRCHVERITVCQTKSASRAFSRVLRALRCSNCFRDN